MTGVVMQLVMRIGSGVPATYTPGQNLFTSDNDPVEDSSHYTFRYIKGQFLEDDTMVPTEVGRNRVIKGTITIPMLYKSLLAQAEYIDPFLDGSRFTKVSGVVDEGRVMATCTIQSVYLKSTSEIV